MLRFREPAPNPPEQLLLSMGDPRPYKCVVVALVEGIEAWLEHRHSHSDVPTLFPYLTKAVVLEYVYMVSNDQKLLVDEIATVLASEPSYSSSSGAQVLRVAAPKLLNLLYEYISYYDSFDGLLS